MKALTQIRHGKADGTLLVLEPGDDIPSDAFTKEEANALVEAGVVGKTYDPDAPAIRPENPPGDVVAENDVEPKGDGRRTAPKG